MRDVVLLVGTLMAVPACTVDTFVSGDAAMDGLGPEAEAGLPGPSCGGTPCQPSETCCVYFTTGMAATYQCSSVACTPRNGEQLSSLACSSTADCALGDVCCIARTNNVNVSACALQCDSAQRQLCDPSAQDAGCPSGEPCASNADWNLPSTFGTCGAQGPP